MCSSDLVRPGRGLQLHCHAGGGQQAGRPLLEKLERNLRGRNQRLKIITGHTGWTDDLEFAFRHRNELCQPFIKKYTDPSAPYDAYEEEDDMEEKARTVSLSKVRG